ncbi:unnamed protein product [Sphagnum troendelagicum]|uniref:SHSP domain-containing protein n=1 Tax=Sphagnum troendelagicum TaxID=128251 RepID=A0ABP0V0V9_9BRYO
MALTPFFGGGRGGRNDIFDPWEHGFWDPWRNFDSVWDRLVPFDHRSLLAGRDMSSLQAVVNTNVDWRETPESHIFKADLPAVSALARKRTKTDTWHRVERSYGKFSRRFHLPDDANMEAVNAKVENGLLTVTVPKIKKTEREVRVVDIN